MLHDAHVRLFRKIYIEITANFSRKIDLRGLIGGTYTVTVASETEKVAKLVVKK